MREHLGSFFQGATIGALIALFALIALMMIFETGGSSLAQSGSSDHWIWFLLF